MKAFLTGFFIGFCLFLYAQERTDTASIKLKVLPINKQKQILILPVIAKSIETSWSGGVVASATYRLSKSDSTSRTSSTQAIALYSLKNQFIAAINGTQYFKNEEYILSEQISYSSFPDKFWGLGKYAPEHAVEDYSFTQYYIDFHLQRNLGKKLFAGLIFEAQNVLDVQYKQGGLFDSDNVFGREGYFVCGIGLSFTYDSRNHAFVPNKGNFAQVYFNHFDKYLGSNYVYTNIVIDYRKYIALQKNKVLALQFFSFTNIGKQVPLRSLATLGGSTSMRGFYDGRFRDKQQLVLQAEYRFPLYKRLSATAFASSGDVGNGITDFNLKDVKYGYGGGLRYAINKSEKLNLRLDYGFNNIGGSGLYLQLGEAF